ncbi:MAG: hypothetical protein F6K31_32585 [Symploca sp. SIO2G7]|nr:hypothetical protein [Symploca sp. SIO2G7]
MNSLSKPSLFSDLSPESASQSKGGHWGSSGCCHHTCKTSITKIRVRYIPGSSKYGSTINVTNPNIDDGSIVNLPAAANINVTNPNIDDGSIVNF